MNSLPTISIIVPVYNTEKYLHKCIDSIINQEYQQLEILLIDDGSTDTSSIICDNYASQDQRIKSVHQSNSNVFSARNKGMELATGKYISFIDSDDYIVPDFYSSLLQKSNNEDIICFGYTSMKEEKYTPKPILENNYSKYKYLTVWTKLFKRSFLVNINAHFLDFPLGEDILFTFNCLCHRPQTITINYCGYYYRNNPTSISNTYYKNQQFIGQQIMKEMGNIIKNNRQYISADISFITFTLYKFILYYLREIAHYNYPQKEYIKEYHALVNTTFTLFRVNKMPRKAAWQKGEHWQTNCAIKLFKFLKNLGLDEFAASILLKRYG